MFYKISYFIFEYTNSTLQVTAVFAKFLHSISYICCQHGIFDTRLALSYVVRDEGGGEGVDNFAEQVRDRWTKSIC